MATEEERPKIIIENNRLRVENVKLLTDFSGGGGARYCALIVKACRRFEEDAFLESQDKRRYSCKSMLDLLVYIASQRETPVDIVVGSNSNSAKELALIIYSSLTNRDSERVGYNRFPKQEIQHKPSKPKL